MRTDPTSARSPGARWATAVALLLAAGPTPAADYVFADGLEDVIHPLPGEVIVTEEMSDPVLAPDADGEWFELLNVGTQTVELTNCLVGDNPAGNDAVPPLKLAPGGTVVFARNIDPLANGGVTAQAEFSFNLGATGVIRLSCGREATDEITWTNRESAGRSLSLLANANSAAANDVPVNFCFASEPYNGSDFGSPGMPNPPCDSRLPQVGEVVVNEVMPDPAGTLLDQDAEWIELRNAATDTVDLGSCVLAGISTLNYPLTGITLVPGGLALSVRSANPGINGGLLADATFGFSLTNSGGFVQLRCLGVVIDDMPFSSAVAGRSVMVDSDGTQCNSPDGVPLYFASNIGSPGSANTPPECP